MSHDTPERLDLRTMNVADDRLAKLREYFPEVFRDGKVDIEALRRSLGEWVEPGKERFGLNWPGKAACMKVIQAPSVGTLLPMREESVDFDTTQNMIIEGDNLEVLKLLQKSYYGKVKMIYIDPPYNTGGEFIYPDRFQEGLQDYLKFSGQVDDEGFKVSTNTESSGRYHTNWLNMMYPRLFLARNLLRDDGVIFVSIDDHEYHTLRSLMNEVFGEENSLTAPAPTTLIWNKQHSQQQGVFKRYHEYVLAYAKSAQLIRNIYAGEGIIEAGALKKISKGNPSSSFTFPAGVRFDAPDGTALVGTFGDSEKVTVERGCLEAKGGKTVSEVTLSAGWTQKGQMTKWFSGQEVVDTKGQKVLEFFFSSTGKLKCRKERSTITPATILPLYGMVSAQTKELDELMGLHVFDNPKPVKMLQDFASWFTADDDIILDFFAGSGTSAHAAFELNANDQSSRRFIMVQLPEKAAGPYSTISAFTRERVRRAGKRIGHSYGELFDNEVTTLDLGFRAYKLTTSNFKPWQGDSEAIGSVQEQLDAFTDNILADRTADDLFTEILLKAGFELTTPTKRLTLAGKEVFSVAEGALLVCLDRRLTLEVIEAMIDLKPSQIICLDAGFQNNDQLKVNAVQAIKSRARSEESTIVFKVV